MVVDNRSLKEIKEDIECRMILLGRVIIMKRITLGACIFTFIMFLYNTIRWVINGLNLDARCIIAVLWLGLSILILLLYNAFQSFSYSLKQTIYNDKKILSKL